MYIFGIDIGGTSIKIGFFNESGDLLDKWEILTNRNNNGSSILEDIHTDIQKYLYEKDISLEYVKGFGFGIPGPVINNYVSFCPNLGWENVDVNKEFNDLLGTSKLVMANNDANVAAAGELWKNPQGYKDIVMITLGTGVGGGILIDGKIVEGNNGAAGEIGHMVVDFKHNFLCGCGLKGCLETVASATGLVRLAQKYISDFKDSSLNNINDITAKDVIDAAKNNDILGIKILDEVSNYIAYAISLLSVTTNPQAFIIGGGVSKAGDILLDYIYKHYDKYAFKAAKKIKLELSNLRNDAGIYGAAYLIK